MSQLRVGLLFLRRENAPNWVRNCIMVEEKVGQMLSFLVFRERIGVGLGDKDPKPPTISTVQY